MRISSIKCYVVGAKGRNVLFVKTETDTGIVGWGEAYCVGPDLAVSRASLGEPVAGDHLPLHLHFSIPKP